MEVTSAPLLANPAPAKWLMAVIIACAALLFFGGDSPESGERAAVGLGSAADRRTVEANLDGVAGRSLLSVPVVTSASPRRIFSDTAMAPFAYNDETSCQNHIRMVVREISSSVPMVVKARADGVHYASFGNKDDNYVLRCFRMRDATYKLFISAAGTDSAEVSEGLSRIYEAASKRIY
jgi:hypothetical protein